MRAVLLIALAACRGTEPSALPTDAALSFTYTATIYQRPGITRATMNGADLPLQGQMFVVVETFPDYATGVASPDVELAFFDGDQLELKGAVGPGACARAGPNCGTGPLIGESLEPEWWQDFTRYDWTGALHCEGIEGACALIED